MPGAKGVTTRLIWRQANVGRLWRPALPALALVLALGCPAGTPSPVVELRLALSAPRGSTVMHVVEQWAATVAEDSGGTLRVEVFAGGRLGRDGELVMRLARARVDIAMFGAVFASELVPELQLLALPMFFRDTRQVQCVLAGPLGARIEPRLAGSGIQLLNWVHAAPIELIGKRGYELPAKLEGRKAGSFGSRLGALFWESLGAQPTPLHVGELATAFQTGLIEVSLLPPAFYVGSGLNRVAPVMTRGELMFQPTMLVIADQAWRRLDASQQSVLRRAWSRMPASPALQQTNETALGAHLANGGKIVELLPEQRDAYRRVLERHWPRMAEEAGPEGVRFLTAMKAARRDCD